VAYRESRLNLWNSMNDLDFLKGFHDGSLPPESFDIAVTLGSLGWSYRGTASKKPEAWSPAG